MPLFLRNYCYYSNNNSSTNKNMNYYYVGAGGGKDGLKMDDPDTRMVHDLEQTVNGFANMFSQTMNFTTSGSEDEAGSTALAAVLILPSHPPVSPLDRSSTHRSVQPHR